MLFILSIIGVLAFVFLFRKVIKKYASIFYIVAAVMTIYFLLSRMGVVKAPEVINKVILKPFSRAAVSTALFTVVMYIGALNKKNPIVKKLFTVRGEMSIVACILTLGHNLSYGYSIFPKLVTNPSSMDFSHRMAAYISIILIFIMIPLMVTSFISVRKKMNFKTWKKIQRSAYVFYMLIYAHIMFLFVPKFHKTSVDIAAYSIIFILYAVLRIRKYLKERHA